MEWYNRSREEGHFFHIFFLPILSSCSRSGRQKSVKALAKCGQRKASCNRGREREIHKKSICNQGIESLKIHFYRKGLSFRTHRRLLAIIHFQSKLYDMDFYIRPKPKYLKTFSLWPNTEAEDVC